MAQKIINTKIQEAYDTEANWIKYNPVLLAGQLAFSKDKYGKYKIGDGIAKWSQLQYMTLGWNDITGKPSSFTPSSHTHDDRYFTETEATNKFSPKEGSASLSKLASTITLGAGDAATILQNGSTYQQKIEIIDNSTSGDAVFGFYQSGDSGKNFNKLMTINDDGNVVANKFTGALAGNASSASSVPWSGVSGKPSTFPPSTHNHPASQITGLPTKLPNPYVLTVKANGYLLNTYDGTAAKEVNITPAVIGAATSGHTHSQYAPTSHNHSADNITSGVLPIGRGGTGGTSLTTAANSLQFESIGEGATTIPNNSDLNTYSTPGTYVSHSAKNTGIKNRPTGTQGAFKLVVKYALGNNGYIQQVMTGYDAGTHMEYTRYYDGYGSNKTWSRWVKTFADNSVIPVTNGGTGANTYSAALKNLVINGAVSGSAVPTDTNWYLCSDTADSSGTPVRRPMSSLWSYIKGKTDANYLKLSGTAVSASSIKVPDTRDTNPAPNNAGFKKNSVAFDFKSAAKINSPTNNAYVGLMSFAPWSETSGGNGYQMAFGYSNATTPRLSIRTADLSATTWGAWYKVYTSADKPTLSELGAAAASHTHNYAGSSSAGGAANSAVKLASARTIKVGGYVYGTTVPFDGTKNIEIPITYIPEARLSWGGTNRAGSVSVIDAAASQLHSANRFAFSNPAGITVEYSRDGSTWTPYSVSDSVKVGLVSGKSNYLYIGGTSSGTTIKYKLRITLDAQRMGVYTALKKVLINVNTNGAGGAKCLIERSNVGSKTNFLTFGTFEVTGWSGWNSIPIDLNFGGGSDQTSNTGCLRFTFSISSLSSSYSSAFAVSDIIALGDTYWNYPSEMSKSGHLYSYDSSQNAVFPANITAKSFIGSLQGTATNATTASKLGTTTNGSSIQPIYLNNGVPVACTYTLGKSVPSNAVFTDTNTWRPIQDNLTSPSTTDSLSANQGKVLKDLIDGKASSNHSHSYLPLSGGTLSGRLTANGRIYATSIGGGWISGMTPTNATLGISTQNSNGSYHPIIACKTYNSHVWNLGTITDTVGFYGFKKGRTENGTDWSFAINVTNGAVSSTGGITAPSFTGYLNGNAKTATNVAWSGIIGRPSTFTPSSHTHNTINDFKSGTAVSISTSTIVTPETASDYDIVVANTGKIGNNKCVVMSKVSFVEHVKNHIIETFPLKAITNSQIDSLASL